MYNQKHFGMLSCATSSSQEIDPFIVRGLKLLNSTDPASTSELRQLWEESIIDKYGKDRKPVSVLGKIILPSAFKKHSAAKGSSDASSHRTSLTLQDLSSNKPRSYSINSFHDDLSLRMLSTDACAACSQRSSKEGNKLVECVDCHLLYHQHCHFPPVVDSELKDPRFAWYCSSCEQNITTTVSALPVNKSKQKTEKKPATMVRQHSSGNSDVNAKSDKRTMSIRAISNPKKSEKRKYGHK